MGLEPTTPCLQSRCSSQLSYVPERGHIVRAARDQDLPGLPSRMPDVRLATAADIGPMAASLSKAFADDPVMAYLMGRGADYDKGVKFFSLMTKIQVPQNHTYVTDKCEAAAVWAPPDKWKVPPLEIAKATPDSSACSAPSASCPR